MSHIYINYYSNNIIVLFIFNLLCTYFWHFFGGLLHHHSIHYTFSNTVLGSILIIIAWIPALFFLFFAGFNQIYRGGVVVVCR